MRYILTVLCILPILSFSQHLTSGIDIKGNNNIIKVIQGKVVHVYNFNDSTQLHNFLQYIRTIPGTNSGIKKLLQKTNRVLDAIEMTNSNGMLNTSTFIDRLEQVIRENDRLKNENEKLKLNTNNKNFSHVLDSAGKLLDEYNNIGYQEILNAYKLARANEIAKDKLEIAEISFLLARNSYAVHKFELALKQIDESLLYDNRNQEYLFEKGAILSASYNLQGSISLYKNMLDWYTADAIRYKIYIMLGVNYNLTRDLDVSISYFRKALIAIQNITVNKDSVITEIYNNMGASYTELGKSDSALYFLFNAAALHSHEKSENTSIAKTYNNIGTCYSNLGDSSKALIYYLKSIAIINRLYGNTNELSCTLNINISQIYARQGEYDKALTSIRQALFYQIDLLGGNQLGAVAAYNGLANIFYLKSDYDSSILYYGKSINISKTLFNENNYYTILSYSNLSESYNAKGVQLCRNRDYALSIKYLLKAIAIQEIYNKYETDKRILAKLHENASVVFDFTGEYKLSIEHKLKQLEINKSIYDEEHGIVKKLYFSIGLSYLYCDSAIEAKETFLKTNLTNYDLSQKLNAQAGTLFEIRSFQKAIRLLRYADTILNQPDNMNASSKKLLAKIYINIAIINCETGDFKEANFYYKKTVHISEPGPYFDEYSPKTRFNICARKRKFRQ